MVLPKSIVTLDYMNEIAINFFKIVVGQCNQQFMD